MTAVFEIRQILICPFYSFPGIMRRRIRGSYIKWRQITHKHNARGDQAKHSETYNGLRIAIAKRYIEKRRYVSGIRYQIPR